MTKLRDWGGPLVWASLLLAFAGMFGWLFVGQFREARVAVPTLSPASLATLELDELRDRLVDVEGFTIDCDRAAFTDDYLLAPGVSPTSPALILVAFEHGSDCRAAMAEPRGPFRAKAKAASAKLRAQLGLEELGSRDLAIVEPHEVGYWLLALLAGFGKTTGAFTYHFNVRDSERELSHFVAVGRAQPIFLDDARSLGFALYHPRDPDYLLVLDEDLTQLARPPFTAAQLRGRFQAVSNEA